MSKARRVVAVVDAVRAAGAAPWLVDTGRRLAAESGARLAVVVLSADWLPDEAANVAAGADEVLVATAPWLATYNSDVQVATLAGAIGDLDPATVLMAHDAVSAEVAPRLAARLGAGLLTECTALRFDGPTEQLVGERGCFSGKAVGEWGVTPGRMAIITLRKQQVGDGSGVPGHPVVSSLRMIAEPEGRGRLMGQVVPPAGEVKLEEAEVVVGVGRGVGSPEAFEEHFVRGLAPAIGAACGGSRGAVDMGIIPPNLQIGLTGRVIAPRVYIAVGLSGSPQHMAGCSGARTIVAVNKDPQAPIFGFAHYGVVGDYRNVVPSLTERLKSLRLTAV